MPWKRTSGATRSSSWGSWTPTATGACATRTSPCCPGSTSSRNTGASSPTSGRTGPRASPTGSHRSPTGSSRPDGPTASDCTSRRPRRPYPRRICWPSGIPSGRSSGCPCASHGPPRATRRRLTGSTECCARRGRASRWWPGRTRKSNSSRAERGMPTTSTTSASTAPTPNSPSSSSGRP